MPVDINEFPLAEDRIAREAEYENLDLVAATWSSLVKIVRAKEYFRTKDGIEALDSFCFLLNSPQMSRIEGS